MRWLVSAGSQNALIYFERCGVFASETCRGVKRARGSDRAAGLFVVVLDELFASSFAELERELGPAYLVNAGSATATVDAFVPPSAVTVISSVRSVHPDSFIAVVSDASGGEISAAIDAGPIKLSPSVQR